MRRKKEKKKKGTFARWTLALRSGPQWKRDNRRVDYFQNHPPIRGEEGKKKKEEASPIYQIMGKASGFFLSS